MANDQKFTVPHGVTTPTVLFASDVVNATDTISATMVTVMQYYLLVMLASY